jgi:tetratricopeptide (TPR) repeat protein
MLSKLIKKVFGKKSAKPVEDKQTKAVAALRKRSSQFVQLLKNKLTDGEKEFFSIKHKLKDLRQTNYDLGLRHIEKGNISDAIFRFRFIKKFWPDHFEAYYQLAYCLLLKNKFYDAKHEIQELLLKNPDYDNNHEKKAQDLLTQINVALEQQTANVAIKKS